MKTGTWALVGWALTGVLAIGAEVLVTNPPVGPALRPGPAEVTAERLNVRGQPRLQSERLAQLQRGDVVWVFEEVVLEKPAPGEPARWARIALPFGTRAWVHSLYVDPTNKVVVAARLNLRAGPGEQYSVLGLLERGDAIVETGVMEGDWIQVEPPTNAYAFVASRYLRQTLPPETAAAPAILAPEQAETEQPVPAPPTAPAATPVTVRPATELAGAPHPTDTNEEATFSDPPPPNAGADPAALEKAREAMRQKLAELVAQEEATRTAALSLPEEVRVVTREGIVRRAVHIQAPSAYALAELETGRIINYLYTTSTNLDLSRYLGRRVLVTGEEGLDPRWKATPVLTIRRIQVFP